MTQAVAQDPKDYDPKDGPEAWRGDARCFELARKDPGITLYFTEDEEIPTSLKGSDIAKMKVGERRKEALKICATCLARIACREYAIKNRITSGVWGETDESSRRKLISAIDRRRKRGY